MWENGWGKNLITKTSWFQGGFWIILPVKFFDCPVIFLPEISITVPAGEQKPAFFSFALWCWLAETVRHMCSVSLPVHITWPRCLIATALWLQTISSANNNKKSSGNLTRMCRVDLRDSGQSFTAGIGPRWEQMGGMRVCPRCSFTPAVSVFCKTESSGTADVNRHDSLKPIKTLV